MKATLFISILMLSFGIYAQSDTLNQIDSLGKKQGYWIIYGKDEPQKGYPDEGKISEGTYIDDRKNGQWILYHKDGVNPKAKGCFVNNRPNGPYEKYYEDGTLKERGTFKKVRYTDTLKRFYESGHLKELFVYDSTGVGLESFTEPQVIRDSAGREIYRIKEPPLVEPNLNDTSKSDSTAPVIRKYYVRDDPDKELIFEGELKYGRFWNGRHYIYDEDGLLLKIEIYKNGEYHSDGQFYSEEPSHSYKRKENECIKKYGPNGEMNATGEFKNGCLWNGRHFIFDKDGLLLKVEVYKNGEYHSDGQL